MEKVDVFLGIIGKKYPLKETPAGDFAAIKANGMKFAVKAFDAEGLGRVSVMSAKGFFGLMKMDTVIVNPLFADLPLYSYDRVFAMGNDTLIIESIPGRDPGEHWYDSIKLGSSVSKKAKKDRSSEIDALAREHFEAFVEAPAPGVTDLEAKKKKAAVYVDGLLEKGGPSTDAFIKAIGADRTRELFRKVLFGLE